MAYQQITTASPFAAKRFVALLLVLQLSIVLVQGVDQLTDTVNSLTSRITTGATNGLLDGIHRTVNSLANGGNQFGIPPFGGMQGPMGALQQQWRGPNGMMGPQSPFGNNMFQPQMSSDFNSAIPFGGGMRNQPPFVNGLYGMMSQQPQQQMFGMNGMPQFGQQQQPNFMQRPDGMGGNMMNPFGINPQQQQQLQVPNSQGQMSGMFGQMFGQPQMPQQPWGSPNGQMMSRATNQGFTGDVNKQAQLQRAN